jgi:hypothetical protein
VGGAYGCLGLLERGFGLRERGLRVGSGCGDDGSRDDRDASGDTHDAVGVRTGQDRGDDGGVRDGRPAHVALEWLGRDE